jgi:hypothetical protein
MAQSTASTGERMFFQTNIFATCEALAPRNTQAALDARKAALEEEKERARMERDAALTRMRGDVGRVIDDRAAQASKWDFGASF